MQTSLRFGIAYPSADRSDSADVPRDIISVVNGLEGNAAMYGQGTLALRPVSTPGSPGKQGRFYMATDLAPHVLYYDYGTGWDSVGAIAAGSIGTVQLADGSVTGGPAGAGVKIAAGTITHDNIAAGTIRGGGNEIAAATITANDLAAALKPSQGAGAGTEALRSIGPGAGQVIAGDDSRLTDARTPAVGHDPSTYSTTFPTTGLFNGYLHTFFGPGASVHTFVYRADLDGTYPWHCVGGNFISGTGSISGTWNSWALLSGSITNPRSGHWRLDGGVQGGGPSQGAAGVAGYVGGSIVGAGSVSVGNSAGGAIYYDTGAIGAGTTIGGAGANSNVVSYNYSGYWRIFPIKVI